MSKTIDINPKSNIKQQSMGDIPAYAGQPVISRYEADSTASQTLINFGFNLNTANKDAFLLYVDGKLLREGASNDFTFTAVDAGGNTSQALLNSPIPAGLNIIAIKLGTKKEQEGLIDGRLTELYEFSRDGFQGFVVPPLMTATATTGAPAAGVFHSNIVNRAPMPDLRNDLGVRFGVDRIAVQSIVEIPNEFGSNGERVFRAVNDSLNRIRFVGNWQALVNTQGTQVYTTGNTIDYVEIVFYGTGLNLVTLTANGTNHDLRASVDGGAEGSSITGGANFSSVLISRNYYQNGILPVVSGLTLGVHTVRIRNNNASAPSFDVGGFEVINQNATATNISVAPGVAYANGRKITDLSQSLIANNAVATGTRGGRVVTFVRADGTVGQSWQAVDASQLNMSAASHSNEEVARVHNWREFGAGRADDFSLTFGTSNRAFTLEDGTTTLVGNSVSTDVNQNLSLDTNSTSFVTITFVGTGLDISWSSGAGTNSNANAHTVSIDGGAAQNFTTVGTGAGIINVARIVSGLPYGTHTVRFSRNVPSVWGLTIRNFIVYQPKKPSIPAGAVELADYNVMANFVANATAGADTIATGILRKLNIREMTYVGTWIAALSAGDLGGWNISSTTVSDYIQYTFFGTGFDFRFGSAAGTSNHQITLNGSTDLSGFTTSFYGPGVTAFTPSTGTYTTTSGVGNGIRVSGLSLGLHVVRVTRTSGTTSCSPQAFDIITPIHAAGSSLTYDLQNSLPVGSLALADSRKFSAIKEVSAQEKNISQALSVTGSPSTTSTTLVPVPDMNVSHISRTGRIKISYSASYLHNTVNGFVYNFVFVNGATVGSQKFGQAYTGNGHFNVADSFVVNVPKDQVSSVALYWNTNTGTASNSGASRNITVEDV
jgi:hypothetical protein